MHGKISIGKLGKRVQIRDLVPIQIQPSNRLNIREPFVPPNPKELLSA